MLLLVGSSTNYVLFSGSYCLPIKVTSRGQMFSMLKLSCFYYKRCTNIEKNSKMLCVYKYKIIYNNFWKGYNPLFIFVHHFQVCLTNFFLSLCIFYFYSALVYLYFWKGVHVNLSFVNKFYFPKS